MPVPFPYANSNYYVDMKSCHSLLINLNSKFKFEVEDTVACIVTGELYTVKIIHMNVFADIMTVEYQYTCLSHENIGNIKIFREDALSSVTFLPKKRIQNKSAEFSLIVCEDL